MLPVDAQVCAEYKNEVGKIQDTSVLKILDLYTNIQALKHPFITVKTSMKTWICLNLNASKKKYHIRYITEFIVTRFVRLEQD